MIQLLPILIFLSFLAGQTDSKCGIIPENEALLSRDSQNWGYGYDSLLVDLDRWNESSFVTIDSLGASVQNRGIWELTIADDPGSSTNHRIYIHARTHPGEEESFWVTNEIINILLSDTPLGAFLRANFIFHIIPMYNPDGVELGYPRNNANGIDIESGWDDTPLEPEVEILKNRFIDLMWSVDNPIEVALNMHSAYACLRYFVYHASEGTSSEYTGMEQLFINSVRSHFPGGIEPWSYYVSWTSGTPDQYPESWWWMNHGQNVLALTYEDMNCDEAGLYDSTANAIVRGIIDYLGLDFTGIAEEKGSIPSGFVLEQNYPNPFNSITTIQYSLPQEDKVTILLYDLKGSQIKTLINDRQVPGVKTLMWNGKNDAGKPVPAGIYLYTMASGNIITTRKMIFLK
jgi:hypothetical protein